MSLATTGSLVRAEECPCGWDRPAFNIADASPTLFVPALPPQVVLDLVGRDPNGLNGVYQLAGCAPVLAGPIADLVILVDIDPRAVRGTSIAFVVCHGFLRRRLSRRGAILLLAAARVESPIRKASRGADRVAFGRLSKSVSQGAEANLAAKDSKSQRDRRVSIRLPTLLSLPPLRLEQVLQHSRQGQERDERLCIEDNDDVHGVPRN